MKILIFDPLAVEGLNIFKNQGFEIDIKTNLKSIEEQKKAIKNVNGIVIRSKTIVNAELLTAANKLKVIGRAGIGLDNVDISAATAKGIIVMNTPGQNSNAAAELAMAHIFALARHIVHANRSIKEGKWEKAMFRGTELKGKTLGILGMGNIGRILAKIAKGIKMKILGYDPYLKLDNIKIQEVELTNLENLLAHADFISIHVPKTKETTNLFNAATLAKIKKGSFLINCARGGIIDEEALCDYLTSGHIAGAALDVFETEPISTNSRLLLFDNIICTPHLGGNTCEAQINVAIAIATQMSNYLKTGKTEFAINASM